MEKNFISYQFDKKNNISYYDINDEIKIFLNKNPIISFLFQSSVKNLSAKYLSKNNQVKFNLDKINIDELKLNKNQKYFVDLYSKYMLPENYNEAYQLAVYTKNKYIDQIKDNDFLKNEKIGRTRKTKSDKICFTFNKKIFDKILNITNNIDISLLLTVIKNHFKNDFFDYDQIQNLEEKFKQYPSVNFEETKINIFLQNSINNKHISFINQINLFFEVSQIRSQNNIEKKVIKKTLKI